MAKPKKSHQKWTPTDKKQLRSLAKSNTPTPQIAKKLERSKSAVENKASDLKVSLKPKDK